MTILLQTGTRRGLALIVAMAVIGLLAAGSACADGRPAASYYTKQQLQAMSQRWAAKAAHDSHSPRRTVQQPATTRSSSSRR